MKVYSAFLFWFKVHRICLISAFLPPKVQKYLVPGDGTSTGICFEMREAEVERNFEGVNIFFWITY